MRKLLPVLTAAILGIAACTSEDAEAPAGAPAAGAPDRQPAPAMNPEAAAVNDTTTVTVDPASATDPPPAVHSTAPAAPQP